MRKAIDIFSRILGASFLTLSHWPPLSLVINSFKGQTDKVNAFQLAVNWQFMNYAKGAAPGGPAHAEFLLVTFAVILITVVVSMLTQLHICPL